jgi:hypothetical protein
MATRKRTRVTEYVDGEDERPEILPGDPAEETYAAFMAKWGREGAKVRVYRVTPQGKQYCFLGTPEEIDPESLRLFHAKQSYAHETGSYLIEVEVNGEVRSPFPILIAPQTNAPGVPEASSAGGAMGEVLKMMAAQNARLEQLLLSRNQEPLGSMADTLIKLDQLRGNQQKELPADVIMRAIELGRSVGGGGGEGDTTLKVLELLKESLPAVLPVVKGIVGSLTQRNGGGGEEVPVINDEFLLKQGLTYLKKKALAGSDPGLYVDLIVDNREEPLYEKLIRRILETDFSAFAAVDAEISRPEYEPFFRTLYDGIRSVFIEPNTVEVDSSGEGGNASNSPGDEKPGKPRNKKS